MKKQSRNPSQNTVCAVVVTYNRKELLLKNLRALENQTRRLDAIFIVDNASTDGTPELLLQEGYISRLPSKQTSDSLQLTRRKGIKIFYLRKKKNDGGAGGFYAGVKLAYTKGYDWIWLMDDDAEPAKDALANLQVDTLPKNQIWASRLCYPKGQETVYRLPSSWWEGMRYGLHVPVASLLERRQRQPYRIDLNTFVGPLINRKIIAKIGFPNRRWFIYFDDTDYCLRAKANGILIFCHPKSIINHPNPYQRGLKLWRWLYFWRNYLACLVRHWELFSLKIKMGLVGHLLIWLPAVGLVILAKERKFSSLIKFFRALWDGIHFRLGKINI